MNCLVMKGFDSNAIYLFLYSRWIREEEGSQLLREVILECKKFWWVEAFLFCEKNVVLPHTFLLSCSTFVSLIQEQCVGFRLAFT